MENHWKTDTIPHYGWGCSDIQDLGDVDATCEMCGYKRIRYVHYMTQEVDGKLLLIKSGCICAGRMEGSEEASKDRERVFKNKLNRRKNWLTRIWKRSRRGNHHLTVRNCHLLVFESRFSGGLWGF